MGCAHCNSKRFPLCFFPAHWRVQQRWRFSLYHDNHRAGELCKVQSAERATAERPSVACHWCDLGKLCFCRMAHVKEVRNPKSGRIGKERRLDVAGKCRPKETFGTSATLVESTLKCKDCGGQHVCEIQPTTFVDKACHRPTLSTAGNV